MTNTTIWPNGKRVGAVCLRRISAWQAPVRGAQVPAPGRWGECRRRHSPLMLAPAVRRCCRRTRAWPQLRLAVGARRRISRVLTAVFSPHLVGSDDFTWITKYLATAISPLLSKLMVP